MTTPPRDPAQDYVTWFRNSTPYINAHRGRTFVVMIAGEAIESGSIQHIVHDLALLNTLGVRLVLVHGARPQISARLTAQNIYTRFERHTRITDAAALAAALDAVGNIRLRIEGLFSMGLANSPMYNASLQVVSGNFVIAKPVGVRDGFDYQHTGEVRRVQVDAIRRQLDAGNLVLLSPIGCSPTGELFNMNSEEVASTAAIALKADKIIYLGTAPVLDANQQLVREITPQEAGQLLAKEVVQDADTERQLTAACHAASNGVARAHVLDFREDGALLRELFTRDGHGTMVTNESYETLRNAYIEDVGGILELIAPLEQAGVLVRRSRERLEAEIKRFTIAERDGMVVACAALYPLEDGRSGEVACFAVHPDYRGGGRGAKLLGHLEKRARAQGMRTLYVLSTQAMHWFQEQGFEPIDVDALPGERKSLYNYQRNSKVFAKPL
ncbi:amino-acid N-acetyltransferase [Isoalcanivorax beigongshangi]|uniref:Amino-acid acetyltransferase n=1 Tax=Isoalcanivorax beigongshangi TaxID=3238810 RepID=A0ABV4ADY2_9GAMM